MKEPITTIIVDDESLARRGLKIRLQEFDDITIVGECSNGRDALDMIIEKQPKLMFLDIQMPGLDGFDVVKGMQGDDMPMVVFVTAFDQYAVDAFNVHAVDYILKPVEEERLQQAVEKARAKQQEKGALSDKEKLLDLIGDITGKKPGNVDDLLNEHSEPKQQYSDKISIKDGSNVTIVKTQDINWIDAAGDYMCVHVGDNIHIMRITMKQLEAQLDPDVFQRVHRSTIVNLNQVKQVCSHMNGEYYLMLECGARLKMSRTFKDKVKHFL
ncbi:LytR/AlgR family response regulator transcription factor [Agarilytica rhodophyticola]|uniref:LytR/AlgR family response regulator transcription factor n=1 Tax=Agarilytica rhodophyticola TaxID=1737490 RepID=UPI000B343304|nr:LytTR family DNA-binding domain-containing protein [Agarilytica rhodophyticola]